MIEHSRGERLIDLLITIARSEYPSEWSRYCELARDLTLEANRQAIGLQRRITAGDYLPVVIALFLDKGSLATSMANSLVQLHPNSS
jgi:hypothetical protein